MNHNFIHVDKKQEQEQVNERKESKDIYILLLLP